MSQESGAPAAAVAGSKRKDAPTPSTSDEEEDVRLDWRMDPEESHSDWTIEIVVAGEPHATYHVHKVLLSVGCTKSEYFARLFSNKDLKEHETNTSRIELEELAARAFPVMLDFVYSLWDDDKPLITHENAVALHYLGGYFEVRRLRKKASAFWIQTMSPDQLGIYFEHAKLFRDEKAYQAVIEKCWRSVESIEENSHLMEVSDAKFWLDVLKQNQGIRDPALSTLISAFCSKRKDQLDAETFLKLTADTLLPEISPEVAIHLLKLEKTIVQTSDAPTSGLTCLQERAVEALSCDSNIDPSLMSDFKSLSPLVLSSLLVRSIEQNKEKDKKLEVMAGLMPKEIIVSGANIAAVNGTYSRTSTLYERAPRFAKDGSWNGNPVKFEIIVFRNNGRFFRYISILNGTRPSYTDGVDKDLYCVRESNHSWRLPPPRTGWSKCQDDDDDDGRRRRRT